MKLPVLIEKVNEAVYRARTGEPLVLIAEDSTRDAALAKLRQLLEAKLTNGTKMSELDIPDQNNPWLSQVGFLDPNDPAVQEWKNIMEDHRKRFDEDPDAYYAYLCDLESAYDSDEDGKI